MVEDYQILRGSRGVRECPITSTHISPEIGIKIISTFISMCINKNNYNIFNCKLNVLVYQKSFHSFRSSINTYWFVKISMYNFNDTCVGLKSESKNQRGVLTNEIRRTDMSKNSNDEGGIVLLFMIMFAVCAIIFIL